MYGQGDHVVLPLGREPLVYDQGDHVVLPLGREPLVYGQDDPLYYIEVEGP